MKMNRTLLGRAGPMVFLDCLPAASAVRKTALGAWVAGQERQPLAETE